MECLSLLLITCFSYLAIWRKTRISTENVRSFRQNQEARFSKSIFLVTAVSFLTWTPFLFLQIIVLVTVYLRIPPFIFFCLYLFYLFIYCILLGRIYNCPEGKGTRGLQRPIRRCPTSPTPHLHTKDSHSTGITLLFSNSAWVLLRPTELSTFKELWDGTSGLSSLSEKTRKSNHLQMKLQRQHFLLSYLKTLVN